MIKKQTAILQYLRDHPTWHHGLDLVAAGLSSRGSIYVHLSSLEEGGWVERREGISSAPGVPGRPQYRATGKRPPAPRKSSTIQELAQRYAAVFGRLARK